MADDSRALARQNWWAMLRMVERKQGDGIPTPTLKWLAMAGAAMDEAMQSSQSFEFRWHTEQLEMWECDRKGMSV